MVNRVCLTVKFSLLLSFWFLASCNSSYEKQLYGMYQVKSYSWQDSIHNKDTLNAFLLRDDNTFLIQYAGRHLEGSWMVGYYGDFEMIELKQDIAEGKLQGRIYISHSNNVQIEFEGSVKEYFYSYNDLVLSKK